MFFLIFNKIRWIEFLVLLIDIYKNLFIYFSSKWPFLNQNFDFGLFLNLNNFHLSQFNFHPYVFLNSGNTIDINNIIVIKSNNSPSIWNNDHFYLFLDLCFTYFYINSFDNNKNIHKIFIFILKNYKKKTVKKYI